MFACYAFNEELSMVKKKWHGAPLCWQVKCPCVQVQQQLMTLLFLFLFYIKLNISFWLSAAHQQSHIYLSPSLCRQLRNELLTPRNWLWHQVCPISKPSRAQDCSAHQQTIVKKKKKNTSAFQTTVSLRLGGGVQTETIRFPSEEWSSFQCHFYILSHSLSPAHWDCRCYLLPSVYLKC